MQEKKLTGYPSIDKPWLKYYTEEDLKIDVPKCTVYQNIYERNKDNAKEIAIKYFGNNISYEKLFAETEKSTKSLLEIGVKSGDCVTLCTAGVPEAIYTVLACSRIGAIANFINPMFTTEQMVDRINDTEAKWIFILDEMYPYIEPALQKTCIKNVVIIPFSNSTPPIVAKAMYIKSKARTILSDSTKKEQKYLSWKEYISIGKSYAGDIDCQYEPDRSVVMVYSSGTTGASKGILLTNDGINATAANYQTSAYKHDHRIIDLQTAPIWFSTGIVLGLLYPFISGYTVIMEPRYDKKIFVKDLLKYKPSVCLVSGSFWLYAIESDELANADLSFLCYPYEGGEKITEKDERRIEDFLRDHGCMRHLYQGYGMCELGSTVSTFGDAEGYELKHGGTGYPMLNATVAAFDMDTGKELKYGERGEIRVFSPSRMKGYYKNPKATEEFFKTDEQGRVWGCTGDIGYIDEDGEVFICGRATDSAVLDSGKKVYLFDIEEVILQEDTISGCKVVAIEENGKTILAAHMTMRNDVDCDPQTLVRKIYENCKKQLTDEAIPAKYKFCDSFPVHTNGKCDNNALKQETDGFIVINK